MERSYSTDLSDAEWGYLKSYLPAPNKRGRPRIHCPREILNAIFYILKSGCPWRLLPREFPPWGTVYFWFRRWRIDETWERLNAALRECLRTRLGRNPQPSAGIVDSQSAKTTGWAANSEDTMVARRPAAGSVTSSWIPRAWSLRSRCTVRRCLTRMA